MIFRGMTYKTNRAHKSFLFFRPEQYYQLSCLKKVEWSGVKLSMYAITIKGDVLLEFSSVKWVLNEDYLFNSNFVGTLLLQNFALVNSYFIHFFVGRTTVEIEGIRFM